MKPALLVIDVQKAFLPYMAEEHRKIAPLIINLAIDLFRGRDLPVYSIYHTDPLRGPSPDSEGFSYDPAIKTTADQIRIIKNHPNSFKNTPLEGLLHDAGCDTVFLCGLSSTGCVLASYFGAKDLGLKTFLIKDALLGPRVAYTDCIEDICDSVNVNVLQSILEGLNQVK
jgi:nicotinamidase-related amidase